MVAPVSAATLAELYSGRIKTLAGEASSARLPRRQPGVEGARRHQALRDNPLCGDQVEIALWVHQGRILELDLSVRGCLLCQAGAAALKRLCHGASDAPLTERVATLRSFLAEGGSLDPAWERELACFAPLGDYPGRRGCVLLPFETLLAALEE